MATPIEQVSGAIAGGLIGSFCGFLSNNVHRWLQERRARRSIACALMGEISALQDRIGRSYLPMLQDGLAALRTREHVPTHHFRGERDYSPVFHSLGHQVGLLPKPLPRDLVAWYMSLAICLESVRELHALAVDDRPEAIEHALKIAEFQYSRFQELVAAAHPLIVRLSQL
jgi:hypothetical protein